jgi:hypothetical protein
MFGKTAGALYDPFGGGAAITRIRKRAASDRADCGRCRLALRSLKDGSDLGFQFKVANGLQGVRYTGFEVVGDLQQRFA